MMCGNGGVGCGVGSGNSGGGVDETVIKGPEVVLKQYFPLARRNIRGVVVVVMVVAVVMELTSDFMLGDWRWSAFSAV